MAKKISRIYKIDGDNLEIQCIKCGQMLQNICFSKSSKWLFWLNAVCKECCKQKYQENRENILQKAKESYKENKEKKKDYAKKYYHSASKNICEQHKKYREENKDKIKQMRITRRINNREKINLQNEKYVYKRCNDLWFDWWEFHSKALYYAKYNKLRPQLCYVCGAECTPHLHHPSYEGFNKRKEVVFVCDVCHKNIHLGKLDCPESVDLVQLRSHMPTILTDADLKWIEEKLRKRPRLMNCGSGI